MCSKVKESQVSHKCHDKMCPLRVSKDIFLHANDIWKESHYLLININLNFAQNIIFQGNEDDLFAIHGHDSIKNV